MCCYVHQHVLRDWKMTESSPGSIVTDSVKAGFMEEMQKCVDGEDDDYAAVESTKMLPVGGPAWTLLVVYPGGPFQPERSNPINEMQGRRYEREHMWVENDTDLVVHLKREVIFARFVHVIVLVWWGDHIFIISLHFLRALANARKLPNTWPHEFNKHVCLLNQVVQVSLCLLYFVCKHRMPSPPTWI